MNGTTMNQPSGPEPVTTTAAECRLTRLAEAMQARVSGVPGNYNFGVLDAPAGGAAAAPPDRFEMGRFSVHLPALRSSFGSGAAGPAMRHPPGTAIRQAGL